jgi:hypothetical protein
LAAGVGAGQLVQVLMPAISGAGGGFDVGAILGLIVSAGAGGAILTLIAGLVKASWPGGDSMGVAEIDAVKAFRSAHAIM